MSRSTGRPRDAGIALARALFVVVAAGCAWWVFRDQGEQLGAALREVSRWRVAAALGCVVGGLAVTGLLWWGILRCYGVTLSPRAAAGIFYVGQLGKYIPGGIWSIGAQSVLARGHGVTAGRAIGAGLVFVALHGATASVVGAGVGAMTGALPVGRGWLVVVAAAGLLLLAPPAVRRAGGWASGGRAPFRVGARGITVAAAAMVVVWTLYGLALWLLMPDDGATATSTATASFALAYVVGVVVVIAPGGLGAREAVVIALLTPAAGLAAAGVAALLVRLVHTVADVLLALAGWLWSRSEALADTPR